MHNINSQNAAEMQRRSTASVLAKRALAADPAARQKIAEKFYEQRLVRVRKQLEKVDGLIDIETDPAKIDRLASAAIRLSEQERQIVNRSLPPVVRGAAEKTEKPPKRAGFFAHEPELEV